MKCHFWTSGFLTAFVVGVLMSGSGCRSDEELCESYDCEAGEELYSCKPLTGLKKYSCEPSEIEADLWCHGEGGVKDPVKIPCDGYGDDGTDGGDSETGAGAPPWDPSSNVTYDSVSGDYLVDEDFLAMLKADPGLILLDSARVEVSSTGYYELQSVAQGDLADAMGLQSGDALVSVNSYSLSSIDSMVDAFYALENATTFVLTISRNGQPMTLTYVVN